MKSDFYAASEKQYGIMFKSGNYSIINFQFSAPIFSSMSTRTPILTFLINKIM